MSDSTPRIFFPTFFKCSLLPDDCSRGVLFTGPKQFVGLTVLNYWSHTVLNGGFSSHSSSLRISTSHDSGVSLLRFCHPLGELREEGPVLILHCGDFFHLEMSTVDQLEILFNC